MPTQFRFSLHFWEHVTVQGPKNILILTNLLPAQHTELGELVGIDGSLIQAVLSMYWADYRDGSKKAKVHVGFDINRGIPSKSNCSTHPAGISLVECTAGC